MDNAHLDELLNSLIEPGDTRLAGYVARNPYALHAFREKLNQVLDVELTRVLGKCKHGRHLVPGCEDCMRETLAFLPQR